MDKYDIYKDISSRTNGDIYIGVVGPVRTGKSTFISKFLEKFVIPNINNKLQKQIATDEMPQSADGKIIMTTQPKFVPANGVKIQFKNKSSANVRLVDCVGYLVEGATGHQEGDKPRLVKTPWDNDEIPFEKAAETGTRKVIEEYSTIGIVVTTDGSFTDIPRQNYSMAEERVVSELKECKKPFIVILNCKNPESEESIRLANDLEEKYGVSVIPTNVLDITHDDISAIMEKILLEFPMYAININLPKWMQALPADSSVICELVESVKENSKNVCKMKDFLSISECLNKSENFNCLEISELKLGEGYSEFNAKPKDGLFYKTISEQCDEKINDDYELMSYIKGFSETKKKFSKIKDALSKAEEDGYGVVIPSIEELKIEEPVLVKQNGRYGVKLKATAPSLHIMKVDVTTEVSPTVGNEKQGEE
ncbi:MAG: stage IV sporulation protein A, partial [Clostridia bacterium]|nr:stage IV sporulation protein A [Clostridia bacterium]